MTRTVTRENLGAWLVRCNPEIWDLEAYVDDGNDFLDDWSVARNYRSRLMEPGDLIFFWVSGSHSRFERGIWGLGHVTGYPADVVPIDDVDTGDGSYYLSEEARKRLTYLVPLSLPLWIDDGLSDVELRSKGIDRLEVQIQANSSNPSWLTKDQLRDIGVLVGDFPEYEEATDFIVSSRYGAYSADPTQNSYVEQAAMQAVEAKYESCGWMVSDVSADNVGWDLTCIRGNEIRRVEVKGVSGDRPIVLLSANEALVAGRVDYWCLAVVIRAMRAPEVLEFGADQVIAAARPMVFKVNLSSPQS